MYAALLPQVERGSRFESVTHMSQAATLLCYLFVQTTTTTQFKKINLSIFKQPIYYMKGKEKTLQTPLLDP